MARHAVDYNLQLCGWNVADEAGGELGLSVPVRMASLGRGDAVFPEYRLPRVFPTVVRADHESNETYRHEIGVTSHKFVKWKMKLA
jgi:hypothetical protein